MRQRRGACSWCGGVATPVMIGFIAVANLGCLASWMEGKKETSYSDRESGTGQKGSEAQSPEERKGIEKGSAMRTDLHPLTDMIGAYQYLIFSSSPLLIIIFVIARIVSCGNKR